MNLKAAELTSSGTEMIKDAFGDRNRAAPALPGVGGGGCCLPDQGCSHTRGLCHSNAAAVVGLFTP